MRAPDSSETYRPYEMNKDFISNKTGKSHNKRIGWIPPLIILTVFLFNLSYLFTDTLWHDDGAWYYQASNGKNMHVLRKPLIGALAPYRNYAYSYGMVNLGVPFTRGIYTFVMVISSLMLFYIYRNVFGIRCMIATPAAVIPNILPSLIGIPVGLNASYAVLGLMPLLASLLVLTSAFKRHGAQSRLLLVVAFACYAFGLNVTPSANFLIPVVLFFCVMFYPANKIRSLFYGLPFLMYGAWQLYKQKLYTHQIPTSVPLAEVTDRIRQFFEMASFLPFNQPVSHYITMGLTIFGVIALLSMDRKLYRQPYHFNCHRNVYRLLITGMPLCWMVSNSCAYVAASPSFRVYDYAYIFNFGAVLLQISGLVFLVLLSFRWLRFSDKYIGILLVGLILFVGIQRIHYKNHDLGGKPGMEKTSAIIRESLSHIAIPQNAQIIVLGIHSQHSGNLSVNSGYMRYLLNRRDVIALIGSDRYPNDVFAKRKAWFDHMCGFSAEKPVVALRCKGDKLERVDLLLQVVSTGRKELPRLLWTLYDIRDIQTSPRKLASDEGLSSYSTYIRNGLPEVLRGVDIAFAPKERSEEYIETVRSWVSEVEMNILTQRKFDEFVEGTRLSEIVQTRGLIGSPVNFGHHFVLRNIMAAPAEKGFELQALVTVESMPDSPFALGYRLNKSGWGQRIPLWDYATKGDTFLIHLPIVSRKELTDGVTFELMNVGRWIFKPLVIQGGADERSEAIVVKLPPDGILPSR